LKKSGNKSKIKKCFKSSSADKKETSVLRFGQIENKKSQQQIMHTTVQVIGI